MLQGKKRATSSLKLMYDLDNEKYPAIDEYYILLDINEEPACIVKNTKIVKIPFNEVTFALASIEGEDECLETWQSKHTTFFQNQLVEINRTFEEDMEIIVEIFEVVHI